MNQRSLRLLAIALFTVVSVVLAQPAVAQKTAKANLKLAAPIADHMVLQHGKETSIWGTGTPGATVTLSFAEQKVSGEVLENGEWRLKVAPLETSATPATMTIESSDGGTLMVKDILVGQVWMCSGQSNMAFTLARSENPNFEDADLPMVRYFKTASKTSLTPEKDCDGNWQVITPESSKNCSAVAYYFGRKLNQELKIPIGLIDTSWGGKPVEAFTSIEKLQTIDSAKPLLAEWDSMSRRFDPVAADKRFEAATEKWKAKVAELKKKMKESGEKIRIPRRPQKQVAPKTDPNHPAAIYNAKVAP